jgi:hypothetical protein
MDVAFQEDRSRQVPACRENHPAASCRGAPVHSLLNGAGGQRLPVPHGTVIGHIEDQWSARGRFLHDSCGCFLNRSHDGPRQRCAGRQFSDKLTTFTLTIPHLLSSLGFAQK